jgi:hypothetical protein
MFVMAFLLMFVVALPFMFVILSAAKNPRISLPPPEFL